MKSCLKSILKFLMSTLSLLKLIICLGHGKFYDFDGDIGYYKWFKLHREDGPAVVSPHGYQHWYLNGKLHRDNAPAVIQKSGYQAWHQHGMFHREDGPAVIYPSGEESWYLNDRSYTQEEWQIEKNKLVFLNNLNQLTL